MRIWDWPRVCSVLGTVYFVLSSPPAGEVTLGQSPPGIVNFVSLPMPKLHANSFDDPAWAIVTQGEIERKSGRLADAIKSFTRALGSFTESTPEAAVVETLICRGVAHAQSGNSDSVIDDFSHAILLNPHRALAYYNRGYSYELLGRYLEAVDDYNRAIEFAPDDACNYLRRGICWKRLNDPAKARSDFLLVRRLAEFKTPSSAR